MDSDAISEVLGAILGFAITGFVVFMALVIFGVASDNAQEVSAVAEAVSIAESIDESLLSLVALEREAAVQSYQLDLQLPAKIQGNPYELAWDTDTLYLNVTNLDINVQYALELANVAEFLLISSESNHDGMIYYDASNYDNSLPPGPGNQIEITLL